MFDVNYKGRIDTLTKKLRLIGCAICVGAWVLFLVVGTLLGDQSRGRLDVIVSDLVAAAQHPPKGLGGRRSDACARDLRRMLDGRAVKWHRITDRAVQFFGFNAVAHVELGLSDGSKLYVYVTTNGRECEGLAPDDPSPTPTPSGK